MSHAGEEPGPKGSGNRTENRGHWPKGKRRNAPGRAWASVRKLVGQLLASPERGSVDPDRPRRTQLGLAAWLGVSDRQVRRWLADDDLPSAEHVARMREWCDLLK